MNQEDIIKEIINNANEATKNGDEEEMPAMYSGDGSNDDPAKADAAQKRGEELKNQGNTLGAVDFFSEAIQSAQPSAKLLSTRAECLLELWKFEAAQRDCDEALKINPDSVKALRIRGKCYFRLGKFQEALGDFSKAQEIDFDEDVAKTIKDTMKISAFEKAAKEFWEKAAAGNIRVKVPDPIMIEKMNVTDLASLMEQWSEVHKEHIWTFKDNGGQLPGGFELHKYPGRQLEMRVLSVNLGHLPSHDVLTTGYAMFQEMKNAPPLTRDEWNDYRNKCAACIEMDIEDCDGIRYTIHEDDFEDNEEKKFATTGGFVVYHICDYISMQISSLLNHTPRTCEGLDTKFPPSCVGIPFPDYPKTIKDFILLNADYFFLYYGIWHNRSSLPIVIDPPVMKSECFRGIGMPKARELMHQKDFRDIQKGKQQFLRFRAHNQDEAFKKDFLWKNNVKGYLLDA